MYIVSQMYTCVCVVNLVYFCFHLSIKELLTYLLKTE